MSPSFTDDEAAEALVQLVGSSGWAAVALARGYLLARDGATDEAVARALFESGSFTLTKARSLVPELRQQGFRALVPSRERTGSAENPITKLFPATASPPGIGHTAPSSRLIQPSADELGFQALAG